MLTGIAPALLGAGHLVSATVAWADGAGEELGIKDESLAAGGATLDAPVRDRRGNATASAGAADVGFADAGETDASESAVIPGSASAGGSRVAPESARASAAGAT